MAICSLGTLGTQRNQLGWEDGRQDGGRGEVGETSFLEPSD